MVVRIRWSKRREIVPAQYENAALAAASLLTPFALLAFTMAFWVVASEMRWTGEFFLSQGLFSHWQVWIAAAAVLWFLSRLLHHYARGSNYPDRFLSPNKYNE